MFSHADEMSNLSREKAIFLRERWKRHPAAFTDTSTPLSDRKSEEYSVQLGAG